MGLGDIRESWSDVSVLRTVTSLDSSPGEVRKTLANGHFAKSQLQENTVTWVPPCAVATRGLSKGELCVLSPPSCVSLGDLLSLSEPQPLSHKTIISVLSHEVLVRLDEAMQGQVSAQCLAQGRWP